MLKQTCIVAAHRGGAANGGETAAQGETAAAKGAAAGERDRAAGVAVQVEEGRPPASIAVRGETNGADMSRCGAENRGGAAAHRGEAAAAEGAAAGKRDRAPTHGPRAIITIL